MQYRFGLSIDIKGGGLTDTSILPNVFYWVKTSWYKLDGTTAPSYNKRVFQNILNMRRSENTMPTLICDSFQAIHISGSLNVTKNLCVTSNCLYDRDGIKLPKIIFDDGNGFVWGNVYSCGNYLSNIHITSNGNCLDIKSANGGQCISFYNSFIENCSLVSNAGDCIHSETITFSNRLKNVTVKAPNGNGVSGFLSIDNNYENFFVNGAEGSNPTILDKCINYVFYNCVRYFSKMNIGDRNISGFLRLEGSGNYNSVIHIEHSNFEMINGPVLHATGDGSHNIVLNNVSTYFYRGLLFLTFSRYPSELREVR